MFSDPYDRLYDKIKDMKLEITDRCDGKVFDYPLEDLVEDCIELQRTGGRGYLFTLDMVFYKLENRIWWVDPPELVFELVKQHAWVDYDENSNPLRVRDGSLTMKGTGFLPSPNGPSLRKRVEPTPLAC